MDDVLYIVMPAYNEQDNIVDVIKDCYPQLDGKNKNSRLVVADSGSTDKTHELLLNLQKNFPKLEIFSDCERYHGSKVVALYKYAISKGADYIFQTDSDGQTVADEFSPFWDERESYDAILGHRKNRGDGKFRSFVEWVCCKCIRFYFGIKVYDSNVPFRLMKSDKLAKFINKVPENHNLPNILVTVYFAINKCKIKFIDVSFLSRDAGKSMYNLNKIMNFGFGILKDFHKIKKEKSNQA